MAYTQAQVDALKDAYAEGTLRVRFGDREVYFDTSDKMLERIRTMQDEVNRTAGVKPVRRRTIFTTRKGF